VVALQELMANQRFTEGHLDVGLALLPHDDPQQEHTSQMERWSLNQPHMDSSPLGIANRHNNTNNQLTGLSLHPTSTGSLATGTQCVTSPQLPRKTHIIGCLYKTSRLMNYFFLHMQPTTHLDPCMSVCLPAYLRAAVEF